MQDRYRACLLGGAIGDALGYPIEFMKWKQIQYVYGKQGLQELLVNAKTGTALISDDTQMTLFTASGMIWAYRRMRERGIGSFAASGTYPSYLRWLYTQTGEIKDEQWLEQNHYEEQGMNGLFIMDMKELYAYRAPGITCLSALESGEMGTMEHHLNHSKGCGGVMRVAPVGLFLHQNPQEAFQVGCELAAITHGHPTGYLTAGVFAMIIAEILNEKSLQKSIECTMEILQTYADHEETLLAIHEAIKLFQSDIPYEKAIALLGQGWVAEEALAIALYCALKEPNAKKALLMSVNHDGDSDSTGAICGNILGALQGMDAIPNTWYQVIELRDFIETMADALYNTTIE